MNCVILQPSYIPWRGFFHQIARADVFVFYDDVQYDKSGWRNRNRVKTAHGTTWLTIPTNNRGSITHRRPINDIPIAWGQEDWSQKHWSKLRESYARAPHFARYAPLVESFYTRRDALLADFTIDTTVALARELGIEHTRFVRSSTLGAEGAKTDRLIDVLRRVGATHYISGPSARDYIEQDKFDAAGIGLEYMTYDYPPYPQLHGEFDPFVSVLDLMFMVGPDAPRYIWGDAPPR